MSQLATAEPTILLSPKDNVAVARSPIAAGTTIGREGVTARAEIPSGHKIAIRAVAVGEPVLKYGQTIGVATAPIEPGDHVHLHNLGMRDSDVTHEFASEARPTPVLPPSERRSFQGYLRSDGQVGTRNYIGIISSVNCSATVVRAIADHFNRGGGLAGFENVDGVVALTHGSGCAMNLKTEGYTYLARTLSGYARNPNFGGILMIGLGCETNQISFITEKYGLEEGPLLRTMTIQQLGGTRKTVEVASGIIREMLETISKAQRTEQPLSGLKVALQCGGSDGYSGISANPALGHAADLVVAHGGTAVLSETPEIYGAEHLLTRRAVRREVGEKLVERIKWWEWYTSVFGAEINNNPSPGNKDGGLTTIYEKSLGALAKGGTSPLVDVVGYAQRVDTPGLVFMDTPGYDPPCTTGLVAGGANVLVFTTGRGSVLGLRPTPCVKVATNTPMYERMADDMDMDAGTILEGDSDEGAGRRMFDLILDVASGAPTRSEQNGVGEEEFAPWHIGPTL